MCGIFGIAINKVNEEMYKNLMDIYKYQKNRGSLGCGVSLLRDNNTLERLRGTESDNLFKGSDFLQFWNNVKEKDLIICHHRFSSSGGNGYIIESNHPFMSENKSISLIHNGVITNATELYIELLQNRHSFESEITTTTKNGIKIKTEITDSEVLIHLLEQHNIRKAIQKLNKVKGSYAIAFQRKGEERIYLYRESNPIIVYKDSFENYYFASELDKRNSKFNLILELKEGYLYSLDTTGLKEIMKVKDIKPFEYFKGNYNLHSFNGGYSKNKGGYNANKNTDRHSKSKSDSIPFYDEWGNAHSNKEFRDSYLY